MVTPGPLQRLGCEEYLRLVQSQASFWQQSELHFSLFPLESPRHALGGAAEPTPAGQVGQICQAHLLLQFLCLLLIYDHLHHGCLLQTCGRLGMAQGLGLDLKEWGEEMGV